MLAITIGLGFLWLSTLTLPNIESFNERRVGVSTKIYDKTGKIVLFDLNQNTRRTVVKNEEISQYIKDATIAIEDAGFYEHNGIEPTSIVRAVIVNILSMDYKQGGSTITQQVVKNSLLSTDKKISRKVKEWFLATNLERIMTKDEILNIYLNENPYGSNIYGVEEAAQAFFGKTAMDVTVAEAAYLAALPQAPTFYSPYGSNVDRLEERKNLVLSRMNELGMITNEVYEQAQAEKVTFAPQQYVSIKAPHFVMYIREYLEDTYGSEALATMGLNVITTLDFELQQKAEEIVKRYALENEQKFNAENAGMVVLDPKTGDILAMVGSRDYFDSDIDGNFNITTARRQPGSTFKPFVYAQAFMKGYEPETLVFDLRTEFSTACNPDSTPKFSGANCYAPENYDFNYVGPISLRNALAQSKNIPAVKTLYLAGQRDSLQLARDMGLTTLDQSRDYGLTLVLGGGEVRLLDLASAYGVFAHNGIKKETTGIIKITDRHDRIVEEHEETETRVLPEEVALKINDILSDNNARTPAFGANSALYFPGRDVAAKTGTTNDYRDAWIVGYTPNIVVGAWAGNNDNSAMEKRVAGMIVAPMWNAFMKEVLETLPEEDFTRPVPADLSQSKPMLNGQWMLMPNPDGSFSAHDILHYVDRRNPTGPAPAYPAQDSQYEYWEYPVRIWSASQFNPGNIFDIGTSSTTSTDRSDRDSDRNSNSRNRNRGRGTSTENEANQPTQRSIFQGLFPLTQ